MYFVPFRQNQRPKPIGIRLGPRVANGEDGQCCKATKAFRRR
jgi:hypothetical protein